MGLLDKAKDALNTEKGQKAVDKGLDKAQDVAKDKLGEDKSEQIDQARHKIDEHLGNGANDENKDAEK